MKCRVLFCFSLFFQFAINSGQSQFTPVDATNIDFILYNGNGQTTSYKLSNSSNMLNPDLSTKVIVHGWVSNAFESWIVDMADRYHQKQNCNVVAVDWRFYGDGDYTSAQLSTQGVGFMIGDWILERLLEVPTILGNIHLVGHSFGAHICGFAGKRVQSNVSQNVDRITGLDAASIGFETPPQLPQNRLAEIDADFVDLIHVTATIGVILPYGDLDFYVNYGGAQLNCSNNLPNLVAYNICNHVSPQFYFSQSITYPQMYQAVKCTDVGTFNAGLCSGNQIDYMGEGVSRTRFGTFYINLDVNGNPTS